MVPKERVQWNLQDLIDTKVEAHKTNRGSKPPSKVSPKYN